MAEAVLFGLATSILESLAAEFVKPGGSFASEKIRLLCGAKDELRRLEGTIQSIQAVLLDAEKQQWHNHQVKLWLKRLKEVLYDVQDLIDDVKTEEMRRKLTSGNKLWEEVCVFFSESNPLLHSFKVANEIQKLSKTLDEIAENRQNFNLEERRREEPMAIGRVKPEVYKPDDQIIGRNEAKEDIKQLLFNSSSSQSVSGVAIVGIGGLGKTALAHLVYSDGDVKKHFGLKMWVCVTDDFDVELVIKGILESAKEDCPEHKDELEKSLRDIENARNRALCTRKLQELLRKIVGEKKYLLVLDDVWVNAREKWSGLGDWLKNGPQGSKILVTTRNRDVAETIDKDSAPYYLKGLSGDASWDLFREVAFGNRPTPVAQRLEEMGRDIVGKCAGVPLAIRTVGSFLYGKNEDEWLRCKVLDLPDMRNDDESDNGIMQCLQFSYDHLYSWLKQCFAYCSLFPKDYVYHKDMIVHLWMAQGFIASRDVEDNLEERAHKYLSTLVDRSFLDVETVGDGGEVLTFKMHDLMHDLASKVAGDECKMINRSEDSIERGTRHVSFASQSSLLQEWTSRLEATNLRTFVSLKDRRTREQDWSPNEWKDFFSKIRHCRCRTLVLPYADFLIPSSLGSRSKHLRFLDISGNRSIKTLPNSIADLLNLQTLKLSGCKSLEALPRDLKKLVNLRHLLIDGCYSLTHMPRGLNHLTSLQTLSKFVVQKMDHRLLGGVGRVDELGDLNKLAGYISLERLEFFQPAPNKGYFENKERLRSLELQWKVRGEKRESNELIVWEEQDELIVWENLRPHQNLTYLGIFDCMGRNPPSWLSSLINVVTLHLHGCGRWKYLPPLSELPSLRELGLYHLDELEFVEEIRDPQQSNTARPFFPSLETLDIQSCGKLKGWWGRRALVGEEQDHVRYDSQSSFPKLSFLRIFSCKNLKYLPPLSELPSLRGLHLSCLHELEFVEEIRDPQQSNTARPFFPSLERLRLGVCGKLKGWWGRRVVVGEEQDHVRYDSQSSFPKLSNLYIEGCHDLKPLPLLPSVIELCLVGRSIKWSEQQVVAVPDYSSEATLVSTSITLSKLKKLEFRGISDLDHSTLETLLPFLHNLESMRFENCSALKSLSSGMQYLSSLQHLSISSCEELDLSSHDNEHGTQWRSLTNLRTLRIGELPKLVSLPEGIQYVTTLQSLSIGWCKNLTSLPEWIGNFSFLQDLEILCCPGIKRLPDGMLGLTSLKRFRIGGCPVLERRCQREDGADWGKIKGIAEILFDSDV